MGVLQQLAAIDFGRLDLHLKAANGTVSVSGSAALTGFEPRQLLGDLGGLLKLPDGLPTTPQEAGAALAAGLAELGTIVQLPDLGAVSDVAARLQDLIALLERAVGQLGGAGGLNFDQILSDAGGLDVFLRDIVARVGEAFPTELPALARVPLEAVAALSRGAPASGPDLAEILSKFVMGIDLGALGAPTARLNDFLARVRAAGGDLDPVRIAAEGLTAQIRQATALLGGESPDVTAAIALLGQARIAMDDWIGRLLGPALTRFTADLAALEALDLGHALRDAIEPLLALVPSSSFDLDVERTMVAPIRALTDQVEALTPEAMAQIFIDLEARFRASVQDAGLEEVPALIDDIFEAIVEQMQRVPLHRLRDQLLDALIDMEGRIRDFAGFQLPHRLTDHIDSLERSIDGVDTAAIQRRVTDLAAKINEAAAAFPIAAIKQELDGIIGSVSQAVQSFTPALQAASRELDDLAKRVESINLDGAGQASLDLMADIRATVKKAVGSGDVPEPLKVALAAGAQALKQIDLSVGVRAPFDTVLATIDLDVLLAPLEEGVGKIRAVLEKATPGAIIQQLDGPFSVLLAELSKLKPAALLAGVSAEFTRLVAVIDQLDPRALVAPLEARFQEIVTTVRRAIDPGPLFEPLKVAYRRLQKLVDLLDLSKALEQIVTKISDMPKVLGDSVRGALAARAGAAAALPEVTASPFQFGDVLRPIALLVAQVRKAIEGAVEAVVAEALALLSAPIAGLRALADASLGPLAAVTQAVEARAALLDLRAETGPVAELRFALAELSATAAAVSLPADARIQVGGATASLQLDARVTALAAPQAALDAQRSRLDGHLASPELSSTLRRLASALDDLIPPSLLAGNVAGPVAARLTAVLDVIDLKGLATELDQLGARIQAKLLTFTKELTRGLFRLWNALIGLLEPVMPGGLLARIRAGMDLIRAELAVLDPAAIEAEIDIVLDTVVAGINAYSPAALAARLGGPFDSVKAKLESLNPATLLGTLDPVGAVITQFEGLRPSVILAPLIEQTKTLEDALKQLTNFKIGDALIQAVAKVKANLELVIANLEAELNALLDDLGAIDASVSASFSAG